MRTGRTLLAACAAAVVLAGPGCDLEESAPLPWAQLIAADGAVTPSSVDAGATMPWTTGHAELELTGRPVVGYDSALVPLGPPHAPLRTRATEGLTEQCEMLAAEPDSCRALESATTVGDGVAATVLVSRAQVGGAQDATVERFDLAVRGAEGWRVVARVAEVDSAARATADVQLFAGARGPLVAAVLRTEIESIDHGWDEVTSVERATLVVAGDRGSGVEALAVVPLLERIRRVAGQTRIVGPNTPPPVVEEQELGWRLDAAGRLSLWPARGRGDLTWLCGDHPLLE